MMDVKYFAVTCKHGHHGTKRYEPITFAVIAENALEACDIAKQMPGVKHDAPVISCKQIPAKTYYVMRQSSAYERSRLK